MSKAVAEQLRLLNAKIDALTNEQREVKTLVQELREQNQELRDQNQSQAQKIVTLENRVDQLEAYTRRDNVIISGLVTQHRSYARVAEGAVKNGEDESEEECASLEDQVVSFLEEKHIKIDKDRISACHALGRRSKDTPPNIIIRFSNRKEKIRLLQQGKKLSGTKVFINEHLTRKNAGIARYARNLRSNKHIEGTWTKDGLVFVKKKDLSVRKILNPEDFQKFDLPAMQVN